MIRFNIYMLFLIVSISFNSVSKAQSYSVTGKVINAATGVALPFVNIAVNNTAKGTSTDIDGKFTLKYNEAITSIKITYVGYETKIITIAENKSNLIIKLKEKQFQLAEVTIVAGENPAHRIIRNVLANRDINNPEKQHSFSYTSYNKLICTSKTDTIINAFTDRTKNDTSRVDSVALEMKEVFDSIHLFMMESVSKRKFQQPDKNYEEVLASRVSGFKNPIFTFVGSQLQSFSFYNERFTIFDKNYVNPISNGCTSKYYYQIEDTIYADNNRDTTFIISYHPKSNTNFEGLKGLLYINTFHWAIENATAHPASLQKKDLNVEITIQQKYQLIDRKQWFPVQLNTILSVQMKQLPYPLIFDARGYLKEINLSPEISKRTFNIIEMEIKDSANLQSEIFWNLHRIDSLSKKELKTYHVVDSIGEVMSFDKKLNVIQALMNNKIPWGIIDIEIDKFLKFNEYEKLRLGLGVHTNEKLSDKFTIGGYWAYGFGDKTHKYGGDAAYIFYRPWDLQLKIAYSNDISESGSSQFINDKKSLFDANYREFFVRLFDNTEKSSVAIAFRALRYMQINLALVKTMKTALYNYEFAIKQQSATLLVNQFNFTDIQLSMRYAYKEKFMKVKFRLIPIPNNYPIVWLNYTKGFRTFLDGEYDYQKVEIKIQKSFYSNYIGKTTFTANAGYADKNLPYNLQFGSRSGYNDAYFDIPNSFNTMRFNEFATNRYVSIMFRHSFGFLLYRHNNFKPEVVILTNAMTGSLDNLSSHRFLNLKSPDKIYLESGLCINNLINLNFYGMGLGVYYRFGAYQLPKAIDNWAFKWTMTIAL